MRALSFLIWVVFLTPSAALAHGGGLNADGCHNNRKTGGYHCHRSTRKAPPPRSSFRSSLNSSSGLQNYGQPQELVEAAQHLLNGLGYDSGIPDGKSGDKTRRAVIQFQQDQSLLPTGLIDQSLLVKLAMESETRLKKVG